MLIRVEDKNLVVGMTWGSLVQGKIKKAIRSHGSKWYWSSGSYYYGVLNKEDSVTSKDLPMYAAAIALSAAHSDKNVLATIEFAIGEDNFDDEDSEQFLDKKYAVIGIFDGKPHKDYDKVVSDPAKVSELISSFGAMCDHGSFTLVGNIEHSGIVYFDFDMLANSTSDFSKIQKLKSEIVNQTTVSLALILLSYGCYYGWGEYRKYVKREEARKLASTQKTAQQQYDEAIAIKRMEFTIAGKAGPSILRSITSMPSKIGGWHLANGQCMPTLDKKLMCKLVFQKNPTSEENNQSFIDRASIFKITDIKFRPDFKTIDGVITLDTIPFVQYSVLMDASISQYQTWIDFGSNMQRFFPFANPSVGEYKPFGIPPGVDASQITKPQPVAEWKQSGPIKILELFDTLPEYTTISSLKFNVAKEKKEKFNQSFMTVDVVGTVFAKAN